MAIRDILFHLDTSEVAQSVRDFAVSLADVTRAHLTAAGVVIEYPPPAADLGGGHHWLGFQQCSSVCGDFRPEPQGRGGGL